MTFRNSTRSKWPWKCQLNLDALAPRRRSPAALRPLCPRPLGLSTASRRSSRHPARWAPRATHASWRRWSCKTWTIDSLATSIACVTWRQRTHASALKCRRHVTRSPGRRLTSRTSMRLSCSRHVACSTKRRVNVLAWRLIPSACGKRMKSWVRV